MSAWEAQFEHVAINLSPPVGSVETPVEPPALFSAGASADSAEPGSAARGRPWTSPPSSPAADRESPPRRRERFFGLPCLYDASFLGQGPLAGLLTALTYARGRGLSYVMTVPSDTPFLPIDLYPRLRDGSGDRAPRFGMRLHTAPPPSDPGFVAGRAPS